MIKNLHPFGVSSYPQSIEGLKWFGTILQYILSVAYVRCWWVTSLCVKYRCNIYIMGQCSQWIGTPPQICHAQHLFSICWMGKDNNTNNNAKHIATNSYENLFSMKIHTKTFWQIPAVCCNSTDCPWNNASVAHWQLRRGSKAFFHSLDLTLILLMRSWSTQEASTTAIKGCGAECCAAHMNYREANACLCQTFTPYRDQSSPACGNRVQLGWCFCLWV